MIRSERGKRHHLRSCLMQLENSGLVKQTMVMVQHQTESLAAAVELVAVGLAVEQVVVVGGQYQNLQANEGLK